MSYAREVKKLEAAGLSLSGTYPFKCKTEAIGYLNAQWLSRIANMFKWTPKDGVKIHCLDTIDTRQLDVNGYTAFFKVDGEYFIMFGTLGGELDLRNIPTTVIVTHPQLKKSYTFKVHGAQLVKPFNTPVDGDCVIIKNTSTWMSFLAILLRWNSLIVENDITIYQRIVRARKPSLTTAPDTKTKNALEEAEKKLVDGDIVIPVDNPFFDGVKQFAEQTSGGEKLTDFVEFGQYCKASLANEFGLDSNYNMKREAIGQSEVEMNADILTPLIRDALKCRQNGCDDIEECFGERILDVDLNEPWKKRIEEEDKEVQTETEPATEGTKEASEDAAQEVNNNDNEENIVRSDTE